MYVTALPPVGVIKVDDDDDDDDKSNKRIIKPNSAAVVLPVSGWRCSGTFYS